MYSYPPKIFDDICLYKLLTISVKYMKNNMLIDNEKHELLRKVTFISISMHCPDNMKCIKIR